MLEDSGFIESKPVTTPSNPTIKPHQEPSKPYHDIPSYRRVVGKLLYLIATRPDIIFCTQQVSQLLSTSTITHFNDACRVLKYLKTCPARRILFPIDLELQLNGYSDVDCA